MKYQLTAHHIEKMKWVHLTYYQSSTALCYSTAHIRSQEQWIFNESNIKHAWNYVCLVEIWNKPCVLIFAVWEQVKAVVQS